MQIMMVFFDINKHCFMLKKNILFLTLYNHNFSQKKKKKVTFEVNKMLYIKYKYEHYDS